jgi:chromosome partitioning protein
MKILTFFNNKGGVGKTSLVYHLAWMFAEQGIKTVAIDLDPQANLSSMFLSDEKLVDLWGDDNTIQGAILPVIKGIGDIKAPHIEVINENMSLIVGDMALSQFEDKLSENWPKCSDGDEAAFRIISAFYRIALQASQTQQADLVLVDVGPNLGAINRSAIIASDFIITPLAPDLYSLQGLKNLGPMVRKWRQQWSDRLGKVPDKDLSLPAGKMLPSGYIIMQHSVRQDRPVKAFDRWIQRMPITYHQEVLGEGDVAQNLSTDNDPMCLAHIKHYQSLMPMAQDAHKPMFFLKPADGAIGSHTKAVRQCYANFYSLAQKIAQQCDIQHKE